MKIKKTIYIIATIFFGLLLSFITHAFLEMWYIKKLIAQQTFSNTTGIVFYRDI